MKNLIIILSLSILLFSSCKIQEKAKENVKQEIVPQNSQLKKAMSVVGIINTQGITTYQYGTHTIKEDSTFYALHSDKVKLNDFVGKKVKIIAVKTPGYPVDGGPDYLKVLRIEIIKENE